MKKLLPLIISAAVITGTVSAAPIEVGVIQPQAGQCAQWGVPITRGVQIWAEEFNNAGGIKDAKGVAHNLNVHAYDNNCYTAGDELTAARRAILDDKVQFILQTFTPASRKATAPLVTQNKVLTTSYGAGYLAPSYPFVIGSVTGSPAAYMLLVSYLLETHPDIKRVAIVTTDNSFGQAALAYYKAGIEPYRDRVSIVYEKPYDPAMANDMMSLLTPVAQSKPDLIVELGFTPGQQGLFVETMTQLGYKGKFGSEGWTMKFLTEKVSPESLAGRIYSAYVVDASEPTFSPRITNFYKSYVAKYGEKEWSALASVAYAAMTTIEAGIQASDDVTGAAVQAKLKSMETVKQPLFGPSKWSGKDIYGADNQLLTPLPVYNADKTGSVKLEKIVDAAAWWQKNKAKALPVLKTGGQVSAAQ